MSTGNPSINMSTKNRLLTQRPHSTQTTKLTSDTKNRLLPNWSSSLSSNFKNLDISSSNLLNKSIYASSFLENEKQPSSPNSKRYWNTYPISFKDPILWRISKMCRKILFIDPLFQFILGENWFCLHHCTSLKIASQILKQAIIFCRRQSSMQLHHLCHNILLPQQKNSNMIF